MTDREKLLELLKDFGIEPYEDDDNDPDAVCLMAHEGNVVGYYDFCTVFEFDEHGNFIRVGVWE